MKFSLWTMHKSMWKSIKSEMSSYLALWSLFGWYRHKQQYLVVQNNFQKNVGALLPYGILSLFTVSYYNRIFSVLHQFIKFSTKKKFPSISGLIYSFFYWNINGKYSERIISIIKILFTKRKTIFRRQKFIPGICRSNLSKMK